jgi:hypothetical protein
MNKKRERKKTYSQTNRLENPKGASAKTLSRKITVFDCAVALYTTKNALFKISNLT